MHQGSDETLSGPAGTTRPKKSRLAWALTIAGLSAAGVYAARKLARSASREFDLDGKVVLITGGSRGLGLALAKEFGRHGSRLALCARDAGDLQEACSGLEREGIYAEPFACDITKELEIAPLVARVIERFGRIDVLVNDAGLIKVGPLQSFEHSDFEEAMDLMFWAPLNLTFSVLPHMKQQGAGQIVNITSVGGRVSVPHLLPYCCAKFAFVGFSTGLSTELASKGIHVLTVVPGLMRTGSYLNARFTGSTRQEFAWFGLLGNLPGFSVAAGYAASCIRQAVERQRRMCTISLPAKLLIASEAVLPETTRKIFRLINDVLLPGSDEKGSSVSGKLLDPAMSRLFQVLTGLGRTAAREFNE